LQNWYLFLFKIRNTWSIFDFEIQNQLLKSITLFSVIFRTEFFLSLKFGIYKPFKLKNSEDLLSNALIGRISKNIYKKTLCSKIKDDAWGSEDHAISSHSHLPNCNTRARAHTHTHTHTHIHTHTHTHTHTYTLIIYQSNFINLLEDRVYDQSLNHLRKLILFALLYWFSRSLCHL